jgi:DNA-binding NarL/FixJ family response regulator
LDHPDRIDSDFHESYRRRPEKLVAAGKTNRRIASELFVSVGTVKAHINNAYRKLDAHSRTQALARELKLL